MVTIEITDEVTEPTVWVEFGNERFNVKELVTEVLLDGGWGRGLGKPISKQMVLEVIKLHINRETTPQQVQNCYNLISHLLIELNNEINQDDYGNN